MVEKEEEEEGEGKGEEDGEGEECPSAFFFPFRSPPPLLKFGGKKRFSGYPGGKFLERNPVRRPACACSKGKGKGNGNGCGFSLAAPGIVACGTCGGGGTGAESGNDANSFPPSPSYYSEPDFYVRAPLRLHGRGFVLVAADEPALRRMEAANHPLASRERAASEARAALEKAASGEASETASADAFGAADLLREALAAVALQRQEREEQESSSGSGSEEGPSRRRGGSSSSSRGGGSPPPSPPPPLLLLLLSPEELGEAFAAAGAPLRGPAQVRVTLARALGGSERPGNKVDAAEVVERLFG